MIIGVVQQCNSVTVNITFIQMHYKTEHNVDNGIFKFII